MSRFVLALAVAGAALGATAATSASAATCTPRRVYVAWACVEGDCAWGQLGQAAWITTTCES